MKNKLLTLLISIGMVLSLTGCNNKTLSNDDMHTFIATIIECEEKSMIVKPNEDERELNSSDRFRINYVGGFNECNVGDKVKITYKGQINESYPAQIGTTNIEIIK